MVSQFYIRLPSNLTVLFSEKDSLLLFENSLGSWYVRLDSKINLIKDSKFLYLIPSANKSELKKNLAVFGILKNLISGLRRRHNIFLSLKGLGLKMFSGKFGIRFRLGFSHFSWVYSSNPAVQLSLMKPTVLKLSSSFVPLLINESLIVRTLRKPDRYKGKGILFRKEKLSLKIGKKS